jgi:hypothetical protein
MQQAFDPVMFFIILVVAEITGLTIAQLFATQGGLFTAGKTIEPWRRRNFIIGVVGFMFCVALAAGFSSPNATPAAAVAGGAGLIFMLAMTFLRIGAPKR